MKSIRPKPFVFFLVCMLVTWSHAAFSAETLDFVLIQPGQPGSSDEAKPIMDTLAEYLKKKLSYNLPINGHYFNRLDAALAYMDRNSPVWGIVSLGFYMENAGRFRMTPFASSRPGGFESDRLRLVVQRDAPADWRKLAGTVSGTVCFEKTAASCLLFGRRVADLPFSLEGSFHPLRSLRAAAEGERAGVILDRRQYEATKTLPLAQKLKVILDSKDLPTSPVVWFGSPGKEMDRLADTLLEMREDSEAKDLLTVLQTRGFGPPDPQLKRLKISENGTCVP